MEVMLMILPPFLCLIISSEAYLVARNTPLRLIAMTFSNRQPSSAGPIFRLLRRVGETEACAARSIPRSLCCLRVRPRQTRASVGTEAL